MKRIFILLLFSFSFNAYSLSQIKSTPAGLVFDLTYYANDSEAKNAIITGCGGSGYLNINGNSISIKSVEATCYDENAGPQQWYIYGGLTCPEGTVYDEFTNLCVTPQSCSDIQLSNEYSVTRNSCFDIGGEFNFICDDTSGNAAYSMPCEQASFCSSRQGQNQIADARKLCAIDAGGAAFTFTEGCSEQTRSINPTCSIDKCDSLACLDSDGDGVKNESDAFPDNPLEWDDSNGDGVGDNAGGDTPPTPTDPDCTLNCDPEPNCDLDPDSCMAPDMDLSDVTLRLDTMTNHQLTALESLQQDNKHLSKLNQRTDITNEMLDKINTGISILSEKSDLTVKKNQAVYDTLDTMRANDLKATVKLTDALDRNSTSNNKLLRDLNTSLGGLDAKLDNLKPEEPEDSGMGKVALDPVDKTLLNGLFSESELTKLRTEITDLEAQRSSEIDSNILALKNTFKVDVSGGTVSDMSFTLNLAGQSFAVPNPLTTWSKYYSEIGMVIMMLAGMSALVIVCSKN